MVPQFIFEEANILSYSLMMMEMVGFIVQAAITVILKYLVVDTAYIVDIVPIILLPFSLSF